MINSKVNSLLLCPDRVWLLLIIEPKYMNGIRNREPALLNGRGLSSAVFLGAAE